MNSHRKLLFVDLETTGANPVEDRITEIGIVCVEDGKASHWSSLVNPQTAIPSFIQNLTGINDAMVKDAPLFETLADDLMARLGDGLFIAHNARFDYGFLRNAFKRMGMTLRSDVLCTVKLSRKLYPDAARHGLAALIERHRLSADARHRALADADVLWQFWQTARQETPEQVFDATVQRLLQHHAGPNEANPDLLQDMPNRCGVYTFYGENDAVLYVSKNPYMRKHAQSHFQEVQRRKPDALAHLVKRVEWQECAGEIGAALLEARLLKQLRPVHNRLLRENGLCSWRLHANADGHLQAILVTANELNFAHVDGLHGLFRSKKKAEAELRELAAINHLCLVSLGLEAAAPAGGPCIAYQSHGCGGACVGKESPAQHQERTSTVLAGLSVRSWPYAGAVGLVELGTDGRKAFHCVRNWHYFGSTHAKDELQLLLEQASPQASFDLDIYKIVSRALALGLVQVIDG